MEFLIVIGVMLLAVIVIAALLDLRRRRSNDRTARLHAADEPDHGRIEAEAAARASGMVRGPGTGSF